MLYRGIVAVCSEIHKNYRNKTWVSNVVCLSVRPCGAYDNHGVLKGFVVLYYVFVIKEILFSIILD
jgi:hypothetical protein